MKTTNRPTRLLLAAAMCLITAAADAEVNPTAATAGVSIDNPSANVTTITAPNNAIIEYSAFNVAANQTVNFVQPSATSRVLNRINSNTPSQIDGTINANGIVYLVNPAGVTFGQSSVVNAASIYAAAGSLSNSDFRNGIDQFTSVTGDIAHRGTINASTIAALIGRNVNNTGTISVPNGTAILASGESVLIGSPLGGVMVQIDATPNTAEGSVTDEGTIDADQVSLVSGDLFSLAATTTENTANASEFRPDVTIADIDTDGDGDIDRDDVRTAFANFTGPLPPGTGGKTQSDGDTDRDGDVDNTDIGTLFIFFTGPIEPSPPTENPADSFDLSNNDGIARLPALGEEVNLSEADLGILRDQLGIAAREPLPGERLEKVQARALYDDLRARTNGAPNPDGSLVIANTRLNADVVQQVLSLYRERLAAEGVTPADRSAQIRTAVNGAYDNYVSFVQEDARFDPQGFSRFVQQNNPALFDSLSALNELNRLTAKMGLNELEKRNSEATIINRARPDAITFEQMKATLQAAGALSLVTPETIDAG